MRINTNILSLTAQRQLATTTRAFQRSLERLASGKRINSARDDAAGMAIGTALESQRRGMNQAIRNMNDAKGFLDTADGALQTQTEIVQRMRELAMQSANGTLSDKDRGYLNREFQQLLEEFNRIATQSNFNGVNLLDGSFTTTSIQVGSRKGETISFSIGSSRAQDIFQSSYEDPGGSLAGTGTFKTQTSAGPGGYGYQILARDINADGHLDLVSGPSGFMLGNGDGTFRTQTLWSAGGSPNSVDAADFNGDGKIDLIAGDSFWGGETTISLALGAGSGTFASRVTFLSGLVWDLRAVDVNNDGKMDIVSTDGGNAVVLVGNGNGTFQARVTYSTGAQTPDTVNSADFNNDGKVDLILSSTVGNGNGYIISVLYGNGNGSFGAQQQIVSGFQVFDALAGDFNNDGKQDLVGIVSAGTLVSVHMGNGNGTFSPSTTYATFGRVLRGDISDLNNDGNLDIIAFASGTSPNGIINILLGRGDGTFSSPSTFVTAGNTLTNVGDIIAADFNEDGVQEIVAADSSYFNYFAPVTTGGPATLNLDVGDMNIATQDSAENVLNLVDSGLQTLASRRANLGAIQNRLDYSQSNAMILNENISAARSQIMDVDVAEETAEFSRLQILQQAGLAVLSQANLSLQMVLKLLPD